MSEIRQEISRGLHGVVTVEIERNSRVVESDWELLAKIEAVIAEHDAGRVSPAHGVGGG